MNGKTISATGVRNRPPATEQASCRATRLRMQCMPVALLALLLWLLGTTAAHAQSWYDASWSNRKPITIDGSKVGGGPHANFPILVSLASDAQIAAKAQVSGNDILFIAADGTTKLDHEIESYTSGTGALVAWVRIPSLTSASNTVIYVYYGNAAVSSQQNATGVWSASYRAVWHFNETSGGTDAVKDSTSNANHGTDTGSPAFGQAGQIGRAVYYDGANKYILSAASPLDPSVSDLTVTAWVRPAANGTLQILSQRSGTGNGRTWLQKGSSSNTLASSLRSSFSGVTVLTNDTWHHIALTKAAGMRRLYVNGVLDAESSAETTESANGVMVIGNHRDMNLQPYNGFIDEMRIANVVRPAGWLETEYANQSAPSSFHTIGAEQHLFNEAQFVSQSVPSTMIAGQAYSVSVTMGNTGTTTWTSAMEYRLGSQNAQDNTTWGSGRVNLPASVGPGASATFTFNVTAPATPGTYNFQWRMVREGIEWFGDLTTNVVVTVGSNIGGFNAFESSTAAGAITGVIRTKVAGSSFSLAVIALNAEKSAVLTSFTGDVKIDVLDASNNSGTLDANGCRSSWTQIQTQTTNFSGGHNGRRNVSFTVSNAHRSVRMRLSFPATGTPTAIGCSNDNFAVRPSGFSVSVTDANWESAGTTRTLNNTSATGGVVHKAGRPFRIAATAVNANAATTTNYDGLPAPSFVYVLPAGASGGSLAVTPTVSNGVYVATASFSEAGVIQLRLVDTTFADVDSADSSDAERHVTSAWIDVGRFVPDHFVVTTDNTPQFRTFNSTCLARSFTYVGQRFGYVTAPRVLLQPRNAGGANIANYRGTLWKIAAVDIVQTYSHTVSGGSSPGLDESAAKQPATVVANANGTGTANVNAADVLAFNRSAPQAPFSASISLIVSASDSSEAGVSGNGTITASTPASFSNIGFDAGNQFRYGRLKLHNAHGSELVSLPIRVEAQHWNGTAFVTNSSDNCTTIGVPNVALGNYQRALGPGHTSVSVGGAFNAGVGTLRLSAPGSANRGSVDVAVNLSASAGGASCVGGMPASTPAALIHLQGAWCGVALDRDPTARATFGVYRAPDRVFYRRENF